MKIGVFDSGLGGLTVVRSLLETIHNADIFYIADTKHAPYGEKSFEEIRAYSLRIAAYFIREHHIDALVVACNTATSAAIATLREHYPELVIVGTEPGIKPAIEQTRTGKVGVLATPATLKGEKYQQLVDTHAKREDIVLFEQACPGLVEQVEKGEVSHPRTKEMLESWLYPMREAKVDTIVLGCTHYPIVSQLISDIMSHHLTLIHTSDAIARRLLHLAQEKGHNNQGAVTFTLMSTGTISEETASLLLGEKISVTPLDL